MCPEVEKPEEEPTEGKQTPEEKIVQDVEEAEADAEFEGVDAVEDIPEGEESKYGI